MNKKGDIKVVVNYPKDKDQLNKVEKIKIDGILEIVFRNKKYRYK